jgi:hypothetical protein
VSYPEVLRLCVAMSLAQARGRWRQEGRMLLWAILVSAVTCPLGASIQASFPRQVHGCQQSGEHEHRKQAQCGFPLSMMRRHCRLDPHAFP